MGLGHSYWAEAAAYSVDTQNLVPSHWHPGCVPAELFSGKRQSVAYFHVFGSWCWAKVPIMHGGFKLVPRCIECRFLGYMSGGGNYKVQEVGSHHAFVLRDVIFEDGHPHHTSLGVGEQTQIPLFDTLLDPPIDARPDAKPDTIKLPDPIPDQPVN